MSKRGMKLIVYHARGVKKTLMHVKRRGKKKQPLQASALLNAPINTQPSQYMNTRPVY